MASIGFIVPTEDMLAIAADALANQPGVRVRAGLATEAAFIADELIEGGAEVIIARAETARTLKNAGLPVPIVEVPITVSDLIHAIETARQAGSRIGVVCFPTMVYDLEWLGQLLGVTLHKYQITNVDDVESAVLAARDAGSGSVIGGGISIKFAQAHHVPSCLIPMGKEAILLAVQHALQIKAAMDLARERNILINTVFDNAYEGIVTVDADGRITSFNPSAERLTKIRRSSALGARIDMIWPSLQLDTATRHDPKEVDQVVEIGDSRLVCFKAPIIVNRVVIGAVATFQEAARIEKMEVAIRKKTYAKGHEANFRFDDIIGSSKAILEAIEIAKDYAVSRFSVLILGETGTGKEIFAQSIHHHSGSADGPFVAINCAALPGQILESELFGYVAGAFTGASREGKPGLFEVAHNGTLFLDEIGEMDYGNQGRLLRFLQEKTVRRLGSDRNIPVNVRIIAATNKDLETLVREKTFREDLFYRLNVLSISLPPLRERTGDVGLFADYFLDRYGREHGQSIAIERSAIKCLEAFSWPGNIRQFENFIARMVITSKTNRISKNAVESLMLQKPRQSKDEARVQEIKKALAQSGGKYQEASAILGVDRSTLWRWLRQYRIDR